MQGIRNAAATVAAIVMLAAGPIADVRADAPVTGSATSAGLRVGVDPSADLAEAHHALFAAKLVRPGAKPDKCSFIPSKNPLKPKKNACRFV